MLYSFYLIKSNADTVTICVTYLLMYLYDIVCTRFVFRIYYKKKETKFVSVI